MNKSVVCAGTLVVSGLVAAVWFGGNLASAQGPVLPIESASAADLAIQGVSLSPSTETATITRSQVIEAARARFPQATVREVFLARFSDVHAVPNVATLCWGVSLILAPNEVQTEGPMPGLRRGPPKYFILFFDAHSGAFIEGISAG